MDDGKAFRTLNILDELSRKCLAIRVNRKLNSTEGIDALTDLFILRGVSTRRQSSVFERETMSCVWASS